MPYREDDGLHVVVETATFVARCDRLGVGEGVRAGIVDAVARNPLAGDLVIGTGGVRKLRVAAPGRGKRGGYRAISYFGGRGMPVFLLTIYSKNEKADLTQAERNGLRLLVARLARTGRPGKGR